MRACCVRAFTLFTVFPWRVTNETMHVWYIPHHGVYHKKKSGKIRVVFDGFSLNQQLLQGPDLTNNLTGVLCRFRMERIAFMCDIKVMFHQVKVNAIHRNYLQFLWWEDENFDSNPVEYRMTVHLFVQGPPLDALILPITLV